MSDAKTLGTRIKECIQIRSKMQQFGIDGLDELAPFIQAMNDHVKDGKRRADVIHIKSIERYFEYRLEDIEGVESHVSIKNKRPI